MSAKFSRVTLCLLAGASACAVAAACSSNSNPGFEDAGPGGGSSSSSGSNGSSSSSGSNGSSSSSGGGGNSSSSGGGGNSSSSSSSGGLGSSSSSSSSGGGTGGGITCAPTTATAPAPTTAANALPLSPANYLPAAAFTPPTAATNGGGNIYSYVDPSSTTNVGCYNGSVFCAAGTAATTGYGVGVGVNLNQTAGSALTPAYTVPAGKLGVSYALTAAPPAKTVLIIDNNGVAYQATVTAASAMVPWAMFAVQTPDAGPPTLSGPPSAMHLQFQIGPGTFNFCVTSLGFY